MENASKAIIIAGGILISLIAISIFYYMFEKIGEFREATDIDTNEQALLDFNKSFEAYNKKIMYGADIKSVLNKAIDNNVRNKVDNEPDNGYYVDVVIYFKNDLQTRVETYEKTDIGTGYEVKTNTENIAFRKNTAYSLRENKDKIKAILIDAGSWNVETDDDKVYNNQDSSVSTYTIGCKTYTVTYYPAAEFKRRIFYCSGVEYHKDTGRVGKMTFMEK